MRSNYIGDLGADGGSTPTQVEALAYFARMTVAPSKVYREAINLAIFKWKNQGTWSLLKGLWLFCAETEQAARLSVIGDAPRDATKTGSPTFIAGKGYEGFSSTAGLTWPITSTILADDGFASVIAGRVKVYPFTQMIDGAAGGSTYAGYFQTNELPNAVYGHTTSRVLRPGAYNSSDVLSLCAGTQGTYNFDAQGYFEGLSSSGRTSNYRTSPVDGNALQRLAAIAYIGSASTLVQTRNFISTLNEMLCNLGALD